MKKKLLSLLVLALLASCNGTASSLIASSSSENASSETVSSETISSETKKVSLSQMIEVMRKASYQVRFEGKETTTFPDDYNMYDSEETISVKRDYGFDKDGSTRACRVYSSSGSVTYFEGENGRIYSQVINEYNQVIDTYLSSYGKYYSFDSLYYSPFDYLTKRDFNENQLSNEKALFLFSAYTGISQQVSSAQVNYTDEGYVTSIELTFSDLPVGFETSDGVETYFQGLTGTLYFDYDGISFDYLTPYEEKSETYEKVINNIADNYTLSIYCNALTTSIRTYINENFVYIHFNENAKYPVEDDMYYYKKGSSYRVYEYNGSSWSRQESVETLTGVIPDFKKVSPYIIEDKEEGHLASKEDGSIYCGEHFILPQLGITSGTCYRSDFYLKDDNLDYVTSTFAYYSGTIVTKSTFTDIGSTSLPLWFEPPAN